MRNIILLLTVLVLFGSCESVEERERRRAIEEQVQVERQIVQEKEKEEERIRLEEEERIKKAEEEEIRLNREEELHQETVRKQEYEKYINNSLSTGATPYRKYYGGNGGCNTSGCSEIRIRTPHSSDVIVTIKRNDEVIRHAYIQESSSYSFTIPNGECQVFFYYGKGWNPNKAIGKGEVKGGFIYNELFSKDSAQFLNNNILEYELILQQNGNFSTTPSSEEEMF